MVSWLPNKLMRDTIGLCKSEQLEGCSALGYWLDTPDLTQHTASLYQTLFDTVGTANWIVESHKKSSIIADRKIIEIKVATYLEKIESLLLLSGFASTTSSWPSSLLSSVGLSTWWAPDIYKHKYKNVSVPQWTLLFQKFLYKPKH